uniref:Neur_chan_LBD domain-containing protein n=1 Tax=Ascaris lumbricoides TaxID=6252 RepID=A0A0M3IMQ8_ASCLU
MALFEYIFVMGLLSFYGSIIYDFDGYEIVIWMDIDCDGTFNRSFTSSYEPSDVKGTNGARWLPMPSSFVTVVQSNNHDT